MEPMSPGRKAEIRRADERAGIERAVMAGPNSPVYHRRELLLELDRVTGELEELQYAGTEAFVEQLWERARLRDLAIRQGRFTLDLTEVPELASAYVAFARALLGDAENYSETPITFRVKIAEEPETFLLTVQRTRPGKLTPHEARQRAEAQRDELLAALRKVRSRCREYADASRVRDLGMVWLQASDLLTELEADFRIRHAAVPTAPPPLSWRWHELPSGTSSGRPACNNCRTGCVAGDLDTGILTCLNCGATAPAGTKATPQPDQEEG